MASTKRPPADPLHAYRSKRDFAVTPEPHEDGAGSAEALSFVVQKHWASGLHYDFRLELDGSMKSWAIPKGPSLDPKVKRMAVHVEDHPISYSSFEGTIPPKQYGAGKVIVWDRGTWLPLGNARQTRQAYRDGNLKFELRGHKLRGKWVLVRMKGKGEKQEPWLLIKERDPHERASTEFSVVDELPDSVIADSPAQPPAARATPPSRDAMLAEAVRAALPAQLAPQLATLVERAPADDGAWLFEIKFDGYRLLTRIDATGIKLFTRNGHDWTAKLAPLQRALERAGLPAGWYDGEIVVPGEAGLPDFGALQAAFESGHTEAIVLYLFDVPYFEGRDLRAVSLEARRAVLQNALADNPTDTVRFSTAFEASFESAVASACKLGLEGVIAKRRDSRYASSRTLDWIKLKCDRRQEFVIAGYTDPQGARRGFGALVLGVYDETGALQYAGNVGTGFNDRALVEMAARLQASTQAVSPFPPGTRVAGRPHWVEPTLVAEVSFAEWTSAGHIRHSVFRGLRADKKASTIVREKVIRLKATEPAVQAPPVKAKGLAERLHVTHPERVIDPSTGIQKIELVRYYDLVGELMMAHLKGRPVSLVRAPSGVGGELFFQKHAETDKLPGVRQLDPALYISHPALIEVASRQGLLSAAQWNVVEFHTMNTGTKSLEHPDRMVFDLDPGEGVAWPQVQEAAQLVQAFLNQLGLPAFLKTSGGKGLHVVVALRKAHDWDTVKGFSQAIVAHLAKTIPQRFVAKSGPKNRVGKIFVDYLRNGLGATTVCAWSARARPGLGISMPVAWSELPHLRGGDHWTVKSAHERIATGNSPWDGYARSARSLTAAMAALGYSQPSAPRARTRSGHNAAASA